MCKLCVCACRHDEVCARKPVLCRWTPGEIQGGMSANIWITKQVALPRSTKPLLHLKFETKITLAIWLFHQSVVNTTRDLIGSPRCRECYSWSDWLTSLPWVLHVIWLAAQGAVVQGGAVDGWGVSVGRRVGHRGDGQEPGEHAGQQEDKLAGKHSRTHYAPNSHTIS